jgi:hypothetical protein
MPSEPVKAIWWFLHWLLKILVPVFWLPLLVMVVLETYLTGRVGGIGSGIGSGLSTLLIGLIVWAVLYGVLIVLNISTSISKAMSDMNRMQQQQSELFNRSYAPFMDMNNGASGSKRSENEGRVVEGTIIEVNEERERPHTT